MRSKHHRSLVLTTLILVMLVVAAALPAYAGSQGQPDDFRFATFNASLNRFNQGNLISDLSTPDNDQAKAVAEINQRTRPAMLLINEFDYDAGGVAAQLFQQNYLSISQNGADPIVYDYRYVAPSNTGIPSGRDFNRRSPASQSRWHALVRRR